MAVCHCSLLFPDIKVAISHTSEPGMTNFLMGAGARLFICFKAVGIVLCFE